MKHYKIVKKTFVSINEYNVNEKVTYIPYIKCGCFWFKLNTHEMGDSGYSFCCETGFKSLEKCEAFVNLYHKYYNKIGKYTIETVKKIDIE